MSSPSSKNKNNQFGLGLIIGFLAGSTAYFLFNTQKGMQLRDKLKEHWQTAQDQIPQINKLMIGSLPVKDLVSIVLFGELSTDSQDKQPKLEIRDTKRTKSNKAQKPRKFKGV